MLLAVLLILLAVSLIRGWQRWQANAYRRAASAELQSVSSVGQISQILKRAALVAYPRADVASLSGVAWSDWLGQTSSQEVPPSVRAAMAGIYAREATDVAAVADFADEWIQTHRTVKE